MISGWLFDAYAKNNKMVFWIKQKNGKTTRLEEEWSHPIYVAADDKSLFKTIIENEIISGFVFSHQVLPKYERLTDSSESLVLQLRLKDSNKAVKLASEIEKMFRFGQIRIYNVDVLPAQTYFYEQDIFPLAYCQIYDKSSIKWNIKDDVWSTDYELPIFSNVHLRVFPKIDEGKIPRYTDRIDHIEIQNYMTGETVEIEEESEADIFGRLMKEIADINPDFMLTDDGDSFTFPYLIERANHNSINLELTKEFMFLMYSRLCGEFACTRY